MPYDDLRCAMTLLHLHVLLWTKVGTFVKCELTRKLLGETLFPCRHFTLATIPDRSASLQIGKPLNFLAAPCHCVEY
jgi:hypothetical protein